MAKKRTITKTKRAFGFEAVEGGYVSSALGKRKKVKPQDDPRNTWDRKHLNVLAGLLPGHYIIWLAATDVDGHTQHTGMSVCAWRIRGQGVDKSEEWPGEAYESSEKKAYVAAAAGALDRLPVGASAEIICREDFLVRAINGEIKKWIGKLCPLPGEKYPRQLYGKIWAHVLDAIERVGPSSRGVTARRPFTADDEDDKIIEELRKAVRKARQTRKR